MAHLEIRVCRHNAAFRKVRGTLERLGCLYVGASNTARHATISARAPVDAGPTCIRALEAVPGVLSVRAR